ncbi:MAG: cupin domain-containing protein [Gemmataceae bacterium]|nr:cupin domain-containing protein [Gemmataceae bacterium]
MSPADDLIRRFNLQPHPKEGGYFRETYRAAESVPADALAQRYGGPRSISTAIYYLLTPSTFSAIHRLQSDEVFHFYGGSPVEMLQLFPDGSGRIVLLGDVFDGGEPQVVVPRGVWQGSRLRRGGEYALLGCTVAPGFDYADYEAGRRKELLAQYPHFAEWIVGLTPD